LSYTPGQPGPLLRHKEESFVEHHFRERFGLTKPPIEDVRLWMDQLCTGYTTGRRHQVSRLVDFFLEEATD
jgi:hypothetical protein